MFDCVMVHDELDLLELRMEMLDASIEKFVIVESTRTHSGIEKSLFVQENMARFAKFASKMIVLTHTAHEVREEYLAWGNENAQRDMIVQALNVARPSDDLFCVCDVDEIPRPAALALARGAATVTQQPIALSMHLCEYYMNYAYTRSPQFRGPFVYNPYTAAEVHAGFGQTSFGASNFRWHMCAPGYEFDFLTIPNAGWHFTYLGGVETIQKKLRSFAHTCKNVPELLDTDYIVRCMIKGKDLHGAFPDTLVKMPTAFLPDVVHKHQEKYAKYLL